MSSPAPVVEFVSARRGPIAITLIILGMLFLLAGGYCFVRGYTNVVAPTDDTSPDAAPAIGFNPLQTEYIGGGITGLFGATVGLMLGGMSLASLKPVKPEAARLEARWLILLAGGLFGLTLMFLGTWLFITWFEVVGKWIGDRDTSQSWKPLTALLTFLVGAGMAFASVQPARAEERNHVGLRRLSYGFNFGLSVVLLLVGLVVANIVVSLKLPGSLDTTDEGFYSLDPLTRDYIAGLTQDVVVYSTVQEDPSRFSADVNRMLNACRDVNPGRFKVRQVAGTDRPLIRELSEKFKGVDIEGDSGILIATGAKESQYSFIKLRELFTQTPANPRSQQEPRVIFQGESKLVNELFFLADNKSRPSVYFIQGNREMALEREKDPASASTPERTCSGLMEPLLRNYIQAKPLKFELGDPNPKVPDDAAVVVLADPIGPMNTQTVTALKNYLNTPTRSGKKGKLIVLSGLHPVPNERKNFESNINEVISPLGITLQDKQVYTEPGKRPAEQAILSTPPMPGGQRNPLGLNSQEGLIIPIPQIMSLIPNGTNTPKTIPLLVTVPTYVTWLESERLANSDQAWNDIVAAYNRRDAEVIRDKRIGNAQRVVAAAATDADDTPRMIVFGFATGFSDAATKGDESAITVKLFLASVNWLRDRPAAANIANKTYGEYRPTKPISLASGFWLPVGGTLVMVIFLGLGVWSYRRK